MRSAGCFLFSLLSIFMVLNVSAASPFGCVAILDLYFSAYLLVASSTVGIPRSLRMSSFLTYHGGYIFKRDIAKFLHYYIVCIAIRNCKRKCTIRWHVVTRGSWYIVRVVEELKYIEHMLDLCTGRVTLQADTKSSTKYSDNWCWK